MSLKISDLLDFLKSNDVNEVHACDEPNAGYPVGEVDTSFVDSEGFVELNLDLDDSLDEPMVAAEIIPELEDLPGDLLVAVWFDGDRVYPTNIQLVGDTAVLTFD